MLSHLLLNLCVLVTLIYLLSLTYRSAQDMLSRQVHWQRVTLLSLLAVALMLYPAEIAPGIIIDMRSVPIAYLALRKGVRAGLIGLMTTAMFDLDERANAFAIGFILCRGVATGAALAALGAPVRRRGAAAVATLAAVS